MRLVFIRAFCGNRQAHVPGRENRCCYATSEEKSLEMATHGSGLHGCGPGARKAANIKMKSSNGSWIQNLLSHLTFMKCEANPLEKPNSFNDELESFCKETALSLSGGKVPLQKENKIQ